MASQRTFVDLTGDAGDELHGPACIILAVVPLVRALAKVRTRSPDAADRLLRATLRAALRDDGAAAVAPQPAPGDIRARLLDLQRRLHVAERPAGRQPAAAGSTSSIDARARGATAAWRVLHGALLQLPDALREALFLADGAGCDTVDLARILGCDAVEASRRVRAGRQALLAVLTPSPRGQAMPRLSARRPAVPVRERGGHSAGCRRHGPARCCRPARAGVRLRPGPVVVAVDEGRAFTSRLGIALYRALQRGCPAAAEGRALRQLIAREKAALTRVAYPFAAWRRGRGEGRTNWLRLMFIAYAAP